MLHGTTLITSARMLGYALSFIRNIMMARMLAKADFGLAAAFATAITLLEFSTRFGFAQLVVQAKNGNSPGLMAQLHGVQLAAGVLSTVLMVALSPIVARIFDVPGTSWAFATLSIVPLANALCHLDTARAQRTLRFLPAAAVEIVPQLLVTAMAWPVLLWMPDYRAIVVLMLLKAVSSVAVSHMIATRKYKIRWRRVDVASILRWGWPLFVSGVIVFAGKQADQLIIGGVFSITELADYAIANSLVSVPGFIIGSVASSVILPILARTQSNALRFAEQLKVMFLISAVTGVLMFVPLALCGEQVVGLLYGNRYRSCGIYIIILAGGLVARVLCMTGTLAALAGGDTRNDLITAIWRCTSIPLSVAAVLIGARPTVVATCMVLGEFVATAASLCRLRRVVLLPAKYLSTVAAFVASFVIAVGLLLNTGIQQGGLLAHAAASAIIWSICLSVAALVFKEQIRHLYPSGNGSGSAPIAALISCESQSEARAQE